MEQDGVRPAPQARTSAQALQADLHAGQALLHEHGHSVNTPTIGQLLTAAHRNTQLGLSQTHLQYNGWSTKAYNYKTTTFTCALPFPSTSA